VGMVKNLLRSRGGFTMARTRKVESISIDKIKPIVFINFRDDDISRISKSIKEIGHAPIIVKSKGKKYFSCSNPEILEAQKTLCEKKIDCIVQDITEQHGKELSIASLLRHPEISTKERECLVWELFTKGFEKGIYNSKADCAHRIGISDTQVSYLCYGKEQREKLFGPDGPSDHISTDTLRFIKKLPDNEQKIICNRIKDKKIHPNEVSDAIFFLKGRTESEKEAILKGEILWKDAKRAIEKGYVPNKNRLNKIQNEYENPKKFKKIIEKEIPYFSSELFRDILHFFKGLDTTYYHNIADETERKQADVDENAGFALYARYMLKRGKIDHELYNTLLKTLNLDQETVEQLKEDGALPKLQEET